MKKLNVLIDMQSYDDKIGDKLKIKKDLPEELNLLKNNVKNAEKMKDDAKKALDQNKAGQKNKELEVKTNKEKMQQYESQQLQVKTNKEFKALNSEISQLKNKNDDLDDAIYKLIESEKKLKEILDEAVNEEETAKKELKSREGIITERLVKIDEEIEVLKEERNKVAKNLPIQLVKRYALLIKNKNRKAVAFIEKDSCGGCGFKLRPQQKIEIESKKKLISCEHCGRIIAPKPDDE